MRQLWNNAEVSQRKFEAGLMITSALLAVPAIVTADVLRLLHPNMSGAFIALFFGIILLLTFALFGARARRYVSASAKSRPYSFLVVFALWWLLFFVSAIIHAPLQ